MQRIIGSLWGVALWLTVWLSPLLLAMAAGCMLVWAVQGDDYLVMHFRTVLLTAGAVGLLPALWLTERVTQALWRAQLLRHADEQQGVEQHWLPSPLAVPQKRIHMLQHWAPFSFLLICPVNLPLR